MIALIYSTAREARPLLAKAGLAMDAEPPAPVLLELPALVICICGMGPVRARAGMALLLGGAPLTMVINPGAAGALVDTAPVGALYRVTNALFWPETATYYPCGLDRWSELPPAVLATVDTPVFDPERRREMARYAQLVDMEGAVIARCCQQLGILCYAIKGVTDRAGTGDRKHLLANLDAVSQTLADTVWKQL